MLAYCFTLFGTYASDRVMAANRASFPRYAGEGRDGGCLCQSRTYIGSAPIPDFPRGRGKEQISDHGSKFH